MADTAIIWKRVESLKEEAERIYADLEADGDLTGLVSSLGNLSSNALAIRDVVSSIDSLLEDL